MDGRLAEDRESDKVHIKLFFHVDWFLYLGVFWERMMFFFPPQFTKESRGEEIWRT